MTRTIRTCEEDSGLWIWEPDAEAKIMGKYPSFRKYYNSWKSGKYCPGEPRFVALDDWVDGVTPGNPIEGCKTWHQALSAVVKFRRVA